MKKIKLLMPIMGVVATSAAIVPVIASCNQDVKLEVKVSGDTDKLSLERTEAIVGKNFSSHVVCVEGWDVANITVKVNGQPLNFPDQYTWDESTYTLNVLGKYITSIDIEVVLTAEEIAQEFDVTYTGEDKELVNISNTKTSLGNPYTAQITPKDAKNMVSSVDVYVDKQILDPKLWSWDLISDTILIPNVTSKNISINITCLKNVPTHESFETDPWSTVIYFADQGVDFLHKAYGIAKGETLVGKTKEIVLNIEGDEVTHHVKVISENSDQIVGSKKRASLTLQFIEVISDSYGDAIYEPFSSGSNNWEQSTLRSYLKTDFKKSLPNDVQQGIKLVNKNTVIVDNSGQATSKNLTEDIFLPSLADIFSASALDSSESGIISDASVLYKNEGSQYAYYANLVEDEDPYQEINALIKHNIGKETEYYWLRSPYLVSTGGSYATYAVFSIYQSGISDYVNGYDDETAIAPVFCI